MCARVCIGIAHQEHRLEPASRCLSFFCLCDFKSRTREEAVGVSRITTRKTERARDGGREHVLLERRRLVIGHY